MIEAVAEPQLEVPIDTERTTTRHQIIGLIRTSDIFSSYITSDGPHGIPMTYHVTPRNFMLS